MIAVVVSAANGCVYCQAHHGAALNAYRKDEERIEQLKMNFQNAGLSEKEIAMCDFAVHLTRHPSAPEANDFTNKLRKQDLTDKAILDVALVTSYFNFVNRMVLRLLRSPTLSLACFRPAEVSFKGLVWGKGPRHAAQGLMPTHKTCYEDPRLDQQLFIWKLVILNFRQQQKRPVHFGKTAKVKLLLTLFK